LDSKPNLIIGSGGHAHCIASELQTVFFLRKEKKDKENYFLENDFNFKQQAENYNVIFGIGGVDQASMKIRKEVFEKFNALSSLSKYTHSTAIISRTARVEKGAVLMLGATVQAYSQIQKNALINTGAVVEHNTVVGAHSHIGPNATLCGNVIIGESCLIGAGSTVIQGLKIGEGSILGAGSTLLNDMPAHELWAGNPAKKIRTLK